MAHAECTIQPGILANSDKLYLYTRPDWLPLPIQQDVVTQAALRQYIYEWGLYRENKQYLHREEDRVVMDIPDLSGMFRLKLLSGKRSVVTFDIQRNSNLQGPLDLDDIVWNNINYRISGGFLTGTAKEGESSIDIKQARVDYWGLVSRVNYIAASMIPAPNSNKPYHGSYPKPKAEPDYNQKIIEFPKIISTQEKELVAI